MALHLTISDAIGLVIRDLICEFDCNLKKIVGAFDIAGGTSLEAYMNGIPDDCE